MNHASAVSYLRDPRLAAVATSLEPAWVWGSDGTYVLWANAAAVALLGATNLAQLRTRRFTAHDRTTAHVVRLANSLPQNGSARLERLRGFGTGFFRLLTCTCSRVVLADGVSAILIAANERAGSDLPLNERARLLLEGNDDALAAFATDGTLLYATPTAAHRMAGANTLIAFEANALAAEALASGASAGRTLVGPTSLLRAGQQGNAMLIANFVSPAEVPQEAPAAAPIVASPPPVTPEPAPTATEPAPVAQSIEPPPEQPATIVPVSEPAQAPPVVAAAPVEPEKPASPITPPQAEEPQRPHPLRFVWQMDGEGRFTLASNDFLDLVGPGIARHVGKPWSEVSAALKLDPEGHVARAIATRDTWSGIVLSWPVDGATQRLKVELSGLPIYDRQRSFIGYRGFGVCRDLDALTTIARQRREAPASSVPAEPAPPSAPAAEPKAAAATEPSRTIRPLEPARQVITFIGPAQNVVPFRVVQPPEPKGAPGLNAGERNTFTEIARQLSARLKSNEQPAIAPEDNTATALRAAPSPGIDGRAPPPEPVDVPASKPAEREEPPKREAAPAMMPAAANDIAPAAAAGGTPSWLAQGSDARALLDRLPLGVLVYRFETMLYANRTFLECVGYDSLPAFSEAGGIDSLFIESSGTSGDSGTQTLTITTGNGDKVPVEGRLFSVPWNGESALALVLVGPKVQHEEPAKPAPAPQRDDSELRERVQSLEAELAAAKRQAETTGNERTDLLGKIGRDVRMPLTAIIGFVETMLNERHGPIGNERYRTFLTDMHYSGSRMLALFDDLASLSKIDRSKTDTAAGAGINLNDVVQGCVTQMQVEASRVRVLIRTSLANPLPGIAAEQDSVRQVVLNLLSNSIRFAGAGGQVIVSTAKDADGRVLLRLRDTGPGLSENDLAALRSNAKPSASADAADQQLTLAVARALLEANHANLSVTSKPGEGTLVEAMFVAAR